MQGDGLYGGDEVMFKGMRCKTKRKMYEMMTCKVTAYMVVMG